MPPDPEDVAADSGACSSVVVTSATAGKVTVLDRETLNRRGVIGGFVAPHIAEIAPGGAYAYVTDDARGTVTVISLADARVTSTIEVGASAHHLSFDAAHARAWVALGESARTIVILSTTDPAHPRVIGSFDPGFPTHDVSFDAQGSQVWVTAADGPDVAVFDAVDRRLLFRVAVGPGPQHVAFDGRFAYLTSGYGGVIEKVGCRHRARRQASRGALRVVRARRRPALRRRLVAAPGDARDLRPTARPAARRPPRAGRSRGRALDRLVSPPLPARGQRSSRNPSFRPTW